MTLNSYETISLAKTEKLMIYNNMPSTNLLTSVFEFVLYSDSEIARSCDTINDIAIVFTS